MALQLQKQMYFLGKNDISNGQTIEGSIESVWQAPSTFNATKTDTLMAVKLDDGNERKIPVFNGNLNGLIAAYGADGHAWIGKRISISAEDVDGKLMKHIRPIQGK